MRTIPPIESKSVETPDGDGLDATLVHQSFISFVKAGRSIVFPVILSMNHLDGLALCLGRPPEVRLLPAASCPRPLLTRM